MTRPDPHCEELRARLLRHEVLRQRGYAFDSSPGGGVIVERRGHALGVWRHDGRRFSWTELGYAEPTHWADGVEAAERYTLVVLASR